MKKNNRDPCKNLGLPAASLLVALSFPAQAGVSIGSPVGILMEGHGKATITLYSSDESYIIEKDVDFLETIVVTEAVYYVEVDVAEAELDFGGPKPYRWSGPLYLEAFVEGSFTLAELL